MERLVGIVPGTGHKDAGGCHKEKNVETHDPVDHDGGQRLGPIARLFPCEHPGLEQVPARNPRGEEVEEVAEEPDPRGVP